MELLVFWVGRIALIIGMVFALIGFIGCLLQLGYQLSQREQEIDRKVYVTYDDITCGEREVAHVWKTKEDAIQGRMDYLAHSSLSKSELREIAENDIYEFEVEAYQPEKRRIK